MKSLFTILTVLVMTISQPKSNHGSGENCARIHSHMNSEDLA